MTHIGEEIEEGEIIPLREPATEPAKEPQRELEPAQ